MDFLFVADIHMSNSLPYSKVVENGVTDRLLDQIDIWKQINKIIKEKNIRALFILGDLFDHSRVDAIALEATVRAINNCDCEVYVLPGNHDATNNRGDRFVVEALEHLKNKVVVATRNNKKTFPLVFNDNGQLISLWMIPFCQIDETEKKIKSIDLTEYKNDVKILLIHNSVIGAETYGWKCDDGINSKLFKKFHKVFAGHFHNHQFFNNGCYIGSPMQHHFGDSGKHSFVLHFSMFKAKAAYLFDERPIYIKNKEFFVFDSFDNLNKKLKRTKEGDFLRFEISCTDSEFISKRKEFETIKNELEKKYSYVEIKHKRTKQTKERISLESKNDSEFVFDSAIEKYVELSETNLSKKKLNKLGKEIFKTVKQ
jgi:DNA repair exonuclease SbcCD nuclease subunit